MHIAFLFLGRTDAIDCETLQLQSNFSEFRRGKTELA